MMPRSQLAALAVLLVGLGVVLVLVGDTGVSTGVYVAGQFTATPSPTLAPSPTPLPEASAENWVESNPGVYSYADPNVSAEIRYQTAPLDELVTSIGLEAPAEDDPYPLVALLNQLRAQLETQIVDSQLTADPDAITGPVIEIVEDTPVNVLRVQIGPQTPPTGQEFGGLDLEQMFVERADEQVSLLQYVQRGEANPVAYNDFRAWLSANIGMVAGIEAEATPEAETTPEAGDTTTGTPEATAEDTTPEATQEPAESAPAATEEAVTPEVTEETAVEATPEAANAAPDAEPTTAPAAALPADQRWMEVQPGQLIYATNPNAFIQYMAATVAELAPTVGVTLEGDQLPTADEMLNSVRARLETQLEEQAITLDEGAFEGPVTEEINGVPFIYLHLAVPPHTGTDGQAQPGQELVMGLIPAGDDRMTAIQFVFQGDPDPAIYADFRAWLEENIVRLSELEVTETEPAAPPAVEPTTEGD